MSATSTSDAARGAARLPAGRLLDRLRSAVRLRHFSARTEETYIHWIRRFIVFHDKQHPDGMGAGDVVRFLSHLAEERKASASTQNQALSALLFLYRSVLGRELGDLDGIIWAKRPAHLPVVLSRAEVVACSVGCAACTGSSSRCCTAGGCVSTSVSIFG
jgi:site-specific recombinase XerD